MNDYISICEQAARAGGAVLMDWRGKFKVREKARADLVTEADLASQEAIRDLVLGAFPDHDFLGEEAFPEDISSTAADSQQKSSFRWIVDPLDGTTNYVHGLPGYSVSVALERDGEMIAGTIFDPISGECFTAEKGGGAFLAGERLATSHVESMAEALIASSFPPHVRRDDIDVTRFIDVLCECQAVRRLGSAALNLCHVAAGRLDAYWATSVKTWDVAAGLLIVREAGGLVTDLDGSPVDIANPRFAASATETLHAELLQLLSRPDK